jgi:mannose-6-phosphate isomerase-like protein (cupin superfamily)
MHHTDTLDFHLVLSGSIDLTLDTGIHELRPGDCAVITGIDHAWRAGPSGCRLSTVMLGTPPPS